DSRFENRAAIFSDFFLHRRFHPVIRSAAIGSPTAAQAWITKDRPLQTNDELKLNVLHCHGDSSLFDHDCFSSLTLGLPSSRICNQLFAYINLRSRSASQPRAIR